jgi:quercetin 2,3-dioxygenase
MPISITPKDQQGYGAFNGGEIVENKPIGFPQDRSSIRPYSSLFYWAHARAVKDSTIGLHPHQGFEICSFVLAGQIRHFDTKLQSWRGLETGDVQIIRAGTGISHSEWMGQGAEMFQIWFDPDLQKTLQQPASYDDYRDADFPRREGEGWSIKTLIGEGSPFRMDTPDVEAWRIEMDAACLDFPTQTNKIYSLYVLEGEVLVQDNLAKVSDFVRVTEMDNLRLESLAGASLFVMATLVEVGYKTYSMLR